jgi:hydroxymethylpyrimidine/phosphomethylpyrimidine kinase
VIPPVVLTIAGVDPSGGAGLAADLATFSALGTHGTCAVTALTAQDTTGVHDVSVTDPTFVNAQLTAVLDDLPVAAVKTGFLGREPIIRAVLRSATEGRLPNLVVDPVLVASDGVRLLDAGAEAAYRDLLRHARVATPNLPEAAVLLEAELTSMDDVVPLAGRLAALGPEVVVVTGGQLSGDAIDLAVTSDGIEPMVARRLDTSNVHGSGCTFAAATAARLALGDTPLDAVRGAKAFVHRQLTTSASWRLGAGTSGPVAHMAPPSS